MQRWHIHHFDEVASTQDIAADYAFKGEPEGTVVVARAQNAGRGRLGSPWSTYRGNLFLSLILRPSVDPLLAGQYSFLVAIALNRALSALVPDGHRVANKWPNDVFVDGKKIAGILLESVLSGQSMSALIIGIGVNIKAAPPDRTSLAQIGVDTDSEEFLEILLRHLDDVLAIFKGNGFNLLKDEWLDKAIRLNEAIQVRLPSRTLNGIFEGLEGDGALRLRLANGDVKVIHSGEVFFE